MLFRSDQSSRPPGGPGKGEESPGGGEVDLGGIGEEGGGRGRKLGRANSGPTVEEFKASVEIRDLKVQFGQEAFIKGFKLCQEKVARKFSELDLSFLSEESEDEVGPSSAATDVAAPVPGTSSSPPPTPEV